MGENQATGSKRLFDRRPNPYRAVATLAIGLMLIGSGSFTYGLVPFGPLGALALWMFVGGAVIGGMGLLVYLIWPALGWFSRATAYHPEEDR